MAIDTTQGYWSVNDDRVTIIDNEGNQIDKNGNPTDKPDGIERNNLMLHRINENGTIGEMVDTINENFKSIAMHGGGPAGMDGINGFNGVDGTNVEYIYALSDEMKAGTHYPTDSGRLRELFEKCDMYHSHPFNNVTWYDHAQPISKDHKDEYVFSRFRRVPDKLEDPSDPENTNIIEGSVWYYADKPVLWAHWGETGRDGDGVEYIFRIFDHELTDDECLNAFSYMDSMDNEMKVIYNIDDFYPGSTWFNDNSNKSKAEKALKNAGLYQSDSYFDTRWTAKFNFCDNGSWTDDPTGTGYGKPYEYVSIRRSNVDEETDKKVWSKYSEPALWSKYSFEGRIFIIYANLPNDQKPTADNGLAPKKGDGWWDVQNDKLIFAPSNGSGTIPSIWVDTNIDPEDGEYVWMCSGIFDHTGKNVSWSNPTCISGKDGQPGEDGTNIQFIYTLSRTMPDFPNPMSNKDAANDLFKNVESATRNPEGYKSYPYNSSNWFDNALPISPENPTEYVWSRTKDGEDEDGNPIWEYLPYPVIWAHWGEDGTDGNGVEYIFKTSATKTCQAPKAKSEMTGEIGKYARVIFNMNDFYPDDDWFTNNHKEKAIEAVVAAKQFDDTLDEGYIESHWDELQEYLDGDWHDNPRGTNPSTPYEFVSIRRCDPDSTPREWGDYSTPVIWSYYGKRTRTFIVYCNVPNDKTSLVIPPVGGWWDMGDDKLQQSKNNASDFECDALSNMSGISGQNVGKWQDNNNDVDGMITYMATGTFEESNSESSTSNNISWSEPNRVTGNKGEKGADGADIEFIYAMEDNPFYPTDDDEKHALFNAVESATVDPNTGLKSAEYVNPENEHERTTWYDNAQAIDKNHPFEYCWSRERKTGHNPNIRDGWTYTLKPFLWAHWGEDGTDGDGIEYIFHLNDDNQLDSSLNPNVTDSGELGPYIEKLYKLNDFYPGLGWFTNTRFDQMDADIQAMWNDLKTKFTNLGWTDNPSGVDVNNQYELVSIRKSHNDANGNRVWEPFSEPVVWATFSKYTRQFMVYCNVPRDIEKPTNPPSRGWWDVSGEDDIRDDENHENDYKKEALTSAQRYAVDHNSAYDSTEIEHIGYWMDKNIDIDNMIVWVSTGVFGNDGENLSWSEPHRITGADGKPGADGSNIQFIYTLSENPAYPPKTGSGYILKYLFEDVEDPNSASAISHVNDGYITIHPGDGGVKYIKYNGTDWYDRARAISKDEPIEYCASRRLPAGATTDDQWVYDNSPFVWAHWGEDGTDGDGIEYIFMLSGGVFDFTDWETYMDTSRLENDTAKTAYSMSDFRPARDWFDKKKNPNDEKSINQKKVEEEMRKNSLEFVVEDWNKMKDMFSFDVADNNRPVLGTWMDNPGEVDTEYQYQYVSIRREVDNEWQPFSEPVLWSKYYISKFTSFAFTAMQPDVNLDGYTPSGLISFDNPLPANGTYNGVSVQWEDTPNPRGAYTEIWMTSAQIVEGKTVVTSGSNKYPKWSTVHRMADTLDFQVEWSSADLNDEQIADLNNVMKNGYTDGSNNYVSLNFGDILKDKNFEHDAAEVEWRNRVIKYTKKGTYAPYNQSGVVFGDDSEHSVLMATCKMKNGVWPAFVVKNVKGETGPEGPKGSSIDIKGRISYEVYLPEKTPAQVADPTGYYTYTTAYNAMVAAQKDNPETGNLVIVYPEDMTKDGVYMGDVSTSEKGGCLYMWKYNGSQWVDYNQESGQNDNGEINGNTYVSPNKHLILWDGDSWQDLGEFQGPEGKRWVLVVKYAKPKAGGGRQFCSNDDNNAKWIGTLTYLDNGKSRDDILNDETFISTDSSDAVGWNWQEFKGQDGYGYEYIFKATSSFNDVPDVPDYVHADDKYNANVIPNGNSISNPSIQQSGWYDEPIEPDTTNKYVWMCWRKFNYSTNEWTPFMGKNKETFENGGKARLWQVYANSISYVNEYFYAANTISPDWSSLGDHTSDATGIDTTFWKDKSTALNSWNRQNKYLFNREVITYSDTTTSILEPHLVSTYDTGVKDIIDYYLLEPVVAGVDTGENPPANTFEDLRNGVNYGYTKYINSRNTLFVPRIPDEYYLYDNGNRIVTDAWISNNQNPGPGKSYWVKDVPKMDAEYPVLWNMSYKIFEDGKWDWTEPIVVGVYGEGKNGADSIYADLDNEMDSIQVNTERKVLVARTVSTNVRMYAGENTTLKITDIDISGESTLQELGIIITRKYYTVNNNETTEHNLLPQDGADYINVSCIIPANCELPSDSTKIEIIVYCGSIARRVSYHLVCTTHPSVYDIICFHTEVLCKNTGTAENPQYTEHVPNSIAITVVERTGSVRNEYSVYNSSQNFKLYYKLNGTGSDVWLSSTAGFSIPTSGRVPGDYFTIRLDVDANGESEDGYETTLDRETIFCINQGKDGAAGDPGAAGNGYRYYYAQYENDKKEQYNNSVNCVITSSTLNSDTPTFTINGVTLPAFQSAQGADENHTFEFRSERYFDGSSWSSWSNPIIIAKYLTVDNIQTEVESAVQTATASINNTLASTTAAVTRLSGYFDNNGKLQSGIASSLMSGYLTYDSSSEVVSIIDAKIASLSLGEDGSINTLAAWLDYENDKFTSIGESLDPEQGIFSQFATQAELNKATGAFDTFKVDAHDKFASMERTVANASYLTDPTGVLLVDVPNYVTWFNTENDMSTNKSGVEADERRNVEWVLCKNGNYFTTAPYKVNDSSIGLSTLYDENYKEKTIALELYVPKSSISQTGINNIKNNLKNVTVAVSLSGDGSPVSYSITSKPASLSNLNVITNSNPGSNQVKLVAYTNVSLDYDSNQSDPHNYTFTSLNWEVGAVSVGTGVSDVSFAYTKMASVNDKPWLVSNSNLDVFDNLTRNSIYGYTIKKDENNVNVPAEIYGTLDITSQEGYDFMLLPAAGISVSDVVNYLTRTGTTTISKTSWISYDKNIPYNTSKEYYVACSYSSGNRPNGPVSYAVELSDSGITNSSNTVNFISTGISDLIDNSISVSMSRITDASPSGGAYGGIYSTISVNNSTVTLSLNNIGASGNQRDIVDVFSIATDYINSQVNLSFSNEPNSENVNYLILPSLYTSTTISNVSTAFNSYISNTPTYNSTKSFYETTENDNASFYFLNNPDFGTTSIYEWKNISDNGVITANFNNAYKYESMYYFTVVVRRHISSNTGIPGQVTVNMTATKANNMVWDTLYKIRVINYPFKSYLLDKISVTIKDRSVSDTVKDSRKRATGNPTSYLSVSEDERPYLIPVVNELATISQTVSDGIASTSIITKSGESTAVFFEQAVAGGGSQIYMNANEIGIESDYFKLDNNGLSMKGNLYAMDSDGKITAGVIGLDRSDSNDIKFFAGTSSYTESTLFNDIDNAPFRVYENGHIVANDIEISAENGNTKLDNEGLHSTELKNTTINVDETHHAGVSYDFPNGNYTGNVSIDTVLNSYGLSIIANGTLTNGTDTMDVSGNRLYIKYFDRITNPDWDDDQKPMYKKDYLYGVPVLCMWYMGQEYIMSPGSWMTNTASDSSNIRWVSDESVYKYGFNDTYANITYCCTSKTSDRPTLYQVIQTAGNYYIFNDTNAGKFVTGRSTESLYKIRVESLGSDETTNKSLISQYGLATDTTSKDTINSTPAKVLVNNIPEAYRGIGNYNTNISPDICQTYKSFIPASATMADILWYHCFDNSTTECQNLYSFMRKIITPSNTGASEHWYETGTSSSSEYMMYGFYGELPYDSSSHANTKSVSLIVDYYPIFTITNGTTVSTSTNMVYAKCTYTVHGMYNPSSSGARFTYTGDSSHNYAVQDFSFTLNFEFVLEFNSNVNNSQIENKIISFLSNFDFTNSSNLLNSHISFEAHLTGLQIINNAFGTSKQISKKVF